MPQFDVHRNKGALKEAIPFVVVVQSSLFDGYRRRVVVPLVRRSTLPRTAAMAGSRMNPVFRVKAVDVVLHPLDMVSVAIDQLGEHVGSLAEQGQQIADALDELLTRSWR
ncbi:MAG: CcdB family protein [Ramlibacter sp.]|nr:CcdB family protein [Ramlibacter sp.]